VSEGWFTVCDDDGLVVLDIFPGEPGGVTLYLAPAEAIQLMWQLKKAIAKAKESDEEEGDKA
jgi:hypothetical protein